MPKNKLLNTSSAPKFNTRVLVAPLDWGLGHATRCIPVIKALIAKKCEVIIASEGAQQSLLGLEFPNLTFVHLPGYRVKYSRRWLMVRLILQLFKISRAIEHEHRWLRDFINDRQIDVLISDNRYGLWAPEVPCIFMTHQLQVQLPAVFKWAEKIVRKKLYKQVDRFNACWVPDLPDLSRALSGNLGHPEHKPNIPVWYIGWLSRFENNATDVTPVSYKAIIILSGPEPQRTVLEKKLLSQLANYPEQIILVRGLPDANDRLELPANVFVYNHLSTPDMQKRLNESEFLISRSGYTTLMDAFTLQKKCILIPTPGQTEQEYLGKRLMENKMALVYPQTDFDLQQALAAGSQFQFHFPLNSMNNLLEMAIDNFLATHLKEKGTESR